jgi:transposase
MYGDADKDHVDYFLQDGDPSQNSRIAMKALESVKAKLFAIPPRSPVLNPIENVFHLANSALPVTYCKEVMLLSYEDRKLNC